MHVLAQGVLQEVAELADAGCFEQVVGQGVDAHLLTPLGGEVVDVHGHRIRAGQLVLDPLEAGGQHDREGQVGIAGGVREAQLDAGGDLLAGLVHRDADGRRPVALGPGDVDGRLVAGHQAPVGVVGRVCDQRHLARVLQHARDELLRHRAQMVLVGAVVEGVLAASEERQVRVHPAPVLARERLGHERREGAAAARDLLDQVLVGLEAVGHPQGILVANVDFVLRGADLMVVVLDRDSHRLERAHGDFADVVSDIDRVDVEVSGIVEELDSPLVLEVEVLRLRPDVHVRASVVIETAQGANQDVARVAVVRRSVGVADLGEHAHRPGPAGAEGQHLGGVRHRERDHVAFLDPLVALNGGAVETHPLLEGARQLLRGDREGLEETQDVGEPEADRADVMLLHVVHDIVDAREGQPVAAVHLIDVLLHLVPTFFRCVQVLVPVHGHAPLRYEKGLGRGPRAPGFRLGRWEVCGNADEGRTRGCRGPPKREAARFPETLRPGPGRRHLRPGTTALTGRS